MRAPNCRSPATLSHGRMLIRAEGRPLLGGRPLQIGPKLGPKRQDLEGPSREEGAHLQREQNYITLRLWQLAANWRACLHDWDLTFLRWAKFPCFCLSTSSP